jgi:hypothetical protein
MAISFFRRDPLKLWQLVTGEGELPFGVMARIALRCMDCIFKRHFVAERVQKMRHAMRPHNRQGRVEAPLFKELDLGQSACCEHIIEPLIDPRV